MINKNNFYVITGGPGVGKTTLLNELMQMGYNCIPEVARVIIKDQMDNNGDALPWMNAKKYSEMMLSYSVRDFIETQETENIHFFDRGIPDTYAYEVLMGWKIGKELEDAARKYRYNKKVFILPPWKEIYHTDNERKQSFEVAIETYEVMKRTYEFLNYNLIEVPQLSPIERAEFVIKSLI